jgi:multiple sugar transport system permease protein
MSIETAARRPSPAAPSQRSRRRRRGIDAPQRRAGWVLSIPALIHIAVFLVIPMGMVVALSFTDYSFTGAYQWIGGANFQELWNDDRFRTALINTVLYSLVTVPFAMALALLIALGLNAKLKARPFYRVAFYMPQVTATVAVATVWLWIYQPDVGLGNQVLGLVGLGPVPWLTSTTTALPSLMLVGIWQGLGAKMVVYLAALQNVNRELVEAAQLDGANRWQVFWNVTWPALAPAQFFVLVTSVISSFQVFELVYVMTKGGPVDSTTVLTYEIYKNAFQGLRLGYASAESVILVVVIGLVTLIGLRLQRGASDV